MKVGVVDVASSCYRVSTGGTHGELACHVVLQAFLTMLGLSVVSVILTMSGLSAESLFENNLYSSKGSGRSGDLGFSDRD